MSADDALSSDLQPALADAAFAFFAADQPMTLDDIAVDGRSRRLSMAAASTPDWFAAAATKSSTLLEVAPELRGVGIEESEPAAADLIHIYGSDTVEEQQETSEADKDIRWHLLKGLADLD